MSMEKNQEIVRRFYEAVFNQGNTAAVEELVAPNFVDHSPFPGQAPDRAGLSQFVTTFRTPLPDLKVEVEDTISQGDKIAVRWKARATHKGTFLQIPSTGKQVTISGIDIMRIADGKIVEHWGYQDQLGFVKEIGVLPALAMAGR
ncbi:MAG TPA: ester cyclase [Anaerolineae bacterium]|nr:ester cyclase [Anaerolineae bacterium]HPL29359.1 ester cyclase [Anaerolineae bacterium]